MGMSRLDNQDFHIATEHKYPNGMGNEENHVCSTGGGWLKWFNLSHMFPYTV